MAKRSIEESLFSLAGDDEAEIRRVMAELAQAAREAGLRAAAKSKATASVPRVAGTAP